MEKSLPFIVVAVISVTSGKGSFLPSITTAVRINIEYVNSTNYFSIELHYVPFLTSLTTAAWQQYKIQKKATKIDFIVRCLFVHFIEIA